MSASVSVALTSPNRTNLIMLGFVLGFGLGLIVLVDIHLYVNLVQDQILLLLLVSVWLSPRSTALT